MIKINLTREELEEAINDYVKDKLLTYSVINNNTIKVTQGKSAYATVLIMPKNISKDEEIDALAEANDEMEKIAGQPDEHPAQTRMFD
jgi:hypothetical protein